MSFKYLTGPDYSTLAILKMKVANWEEMVYEGSKENELRLAKLL